MEAEEFRTLVFQVLGFYEYLKEGRGVPKLLTGTMNGMQALKDSRISFGVMAFTKKFKKRGLQPTTPPTSAFTTTEIF